jgi:hypothetical protein
MFNQNTLEYLNIQNFKNFLSTGTYNNPDRYSLLLLKKVQNIFNELNNKEKEAILFLSHNEFAKKEKFWFNEKELKDYIKFITEIENFDLKKIMLGTLEYSKRSYILTNFRTKTADDFLLKANGSEVFYFTFPIKRFNHDVYAKNLNKETSLF